MRTTPTALARRRRPLARSAAPLTAALLLALTVPSAPALPNAGPASASGRGWGTAIACIGCVAVGSAIVASGGTAALITAAFIPGSTLAVAGCVYSCYDAITG